jgi:hypothetical protein
MKWITSQSLLHPSDITGGGQSMVATQVREDRK